MSARSTTDRNLTEELTAIRRSIDEHNRIIRRSRLWLLGLGGVFTLVTTLGVIVYLDDQADDTRACRQDNENSIRDSEVLIGVVLQGEITSQVEETVARYREDVQANLRPC